MTPSPSPHARGSGGPPGPATHQAQLLNARRLMIAGAREEAHALCRRLSSAGPADTASLRAVAAVQADFCDFEGARVTLERALGASPNDGDLLNAMARTYLDEGNLPEAIRAAERGLACIPQNAGFIAIKAQALILSGDSHGAWEAMRPLLEAGKTNLALVPPLARIARRVGQEQRAVDLINGHLASSALSARMRIELLFRLGDLRDAAGDPDAAFAAYEEANRIRRSSAPYDVARSVAVVDELIARWRPGPLRASDRSERPLFIIGMPRSGTSLVEQILGSHPDVGAGGEMQEVPMLAHKLQGSMAGGLPVFTRAQHLTLERLDAGARAYHKLLARMFPGAARVTDKLPINFLNLGLISLLFPGARAIHCTRDPMDTCLSCYFQNFGGFVPFAYDLRDLGVFYRAYRRLMEHWAGTLDFPVLEAPYEEMVADQERVSRRLVEFVGLPWDDRCLRFYESKRVVLTSSNEQVRRPVYKSSVARWKHYEKYLGPLREALGG